MSATLDPSTKGGSRALERLASDKIGWLTTVKGDGQPQSSPLWFLWTGDEILVYSQTTTPRLRNLASNPRVAFSLHTDPGGGGVVSMEGTSSVDPEGPLCSSNPPYVAKYSEMLAASGSDPTWRIVSTRWPSGSRRHAGGWADPPQISGAMRAAARAAPSVSTGR